MEKTKIWPSQINLGARPTEIACIWTTKVYDACSQKECEDFVFGQPPEADGLLTVECAIEPGSEYLASANIVPIDEGPLGKVEVDVCAKLNITCLNGSSTYSFQEDVCFQKEVVLYAPDPINMEVLVEAIFESLACSFNNSNQIVATIGAFIIVKTALQVQLLVPAYGFCPVPPECEELGDLCEQFFERPFPPFFPPQLTDLGEDE